MKRKHRDLDIFSLSFLDIISCGFGAVVILVLISSNSTLPLPASKGEVTLLLHQVLSKEKVVKDLQKNLENEINDVASKELQLQNVQDISKSLILQQNSAAELSENLQEDLTGLKLVQNSLLKLKSESNSLRSEVKRIAEVGGIPVDSDYVVFIVDTSGSMKEIWNRVTKELENVIRIHPKIKGFQILNDNGAHILSGYKGRWIPDTPKRRESVISLFKNWNSASNSSPVEGLEVALRSYANPNTKLSVYIFGDEYSGSSYDPVINAVVNLNKNRVSGRPLARIHAVGFISNFSTGRFATLMREVTRRNNGTFIALPR
jgi:hypothetical protein